MGLCRDNIRSPIAITHMQIAIYTVYVKQFMPSLDKCKTFNNNKNQHNLLMQSILFYIDMCILSHVTFCIAKPIRLATEWLL